MSSPDAYYELLIAFTQIIDSVIESVSSINIMCRLKYTGSGPGGSDPDSDDLLNVPI